MAIRKILRLSAVEEATGFKKSQIYNLMAKGQFPRPLRLSEQAVG
jgi:prophage regulatory protein